MERQKPLNFNLMWLNPSYLDAWIVGREIESVEDQEWFY